VVVSAGPGGDIWPMPETFPTLPEKEDASGLQVRGLTKSYQVGRAALPVLTGLGSVEIQDSLMS